MSSNQAAKKIQRFWKKTAHKKIALLRRDMLHQGPTMNHTAAIR
jgi:hypothetical protein